MYVDGAHIKDWGAIAAVLIEAAKDQDPQRVVRMYWQVTEEVNGALKTSVVPTDRPARNQAFRALPVIGSYGWKLKGIAPSLVALVNCEDAELRLAAVRGLLSLVAAYLTQIQTPSQPPAIDPQRAAGAVLEDIKLAMQTIRTAGMSTDPAIAEAATRFLALNEPKWQAAAEVIPELE